MGKVRKAMWKSIEVPKEAFIQIDDINQRIITIVRNSKSESTLTIDYYPQSHTKTKEQNYENQ